MTSPDVRDSAEWVRLPWDSNHFGIPIGRIVASSVTELELSSALRSAEEAGIRCLYWLSDPKSAQIENAQRAGFEMVDRRVGMEIRVAANLPASPGTIRVADELDLNPLKMLASKSHRNTRFYSDKAFPMDRADALYGAWIERSFHDSRQQVLVSGPLGSPVAYVACDLGQNDGVGVIGLIAVAESSRGIGLGTTLAQGAIQWFSDHGVTRIEVVTQGDNMAAQGLYKKLGFSTTATSIWFHRWF